MPRLSQAEIRNNAIAFVHEWKGETRESAESQTFWNEFFEVFGVKRRSVAVFERAVKRSSGKFGKIDLFWKGVVLAEHKSAGENLDKATSQAFEYLQNVEETELPQFVLISDFANFRVYDLESGAEFTFPLAKLSDKIQLFGFISGYLKREFKEQDPVNIKAALKLGVLHDALLASGYQGHKLEVFLVRLVYCLFADNTQIFEPRGSFRNFLNDKTAADGSNTGAMLGQLFQILDTPDADRQTTLDEDLRGFQYVNGALFRDHFDMPFFDASMRRLLIEACDVNWGKVSPAIFGSLFQSVMDKDKRRNLGAHYTSEKNILKVVHGLFLDDLLAEFEAIKNNLGKLKQFQDKLARLRFFDPACGCGNFLVITYREMRRLELSVLKQIRSLTGNIQGELAATKLSKLSVDSYFGIEVEEFPVEIARVALWVTDHLANLELSAEFGVAQFELPLEHTPNIVHGNALRLGWRDVVGTPDVNLFILGNPPFVGGKMMNDEQRADMAYVCGEVQNYGLLDYVCAWYVKTATFLKTLPPDLNEGINFDHVPRASVAFVSTNSITQGEQVGILWPFMIANGFAIRFAHRTFKWSNEASGKAAVYCVIIGFGKYEFWPKRLFDYESPISEPHELLVNKLNPYLVPAADVVVTRRHLPLCDVPPMHFGNMPLDGGNLIIADESEKRALLDVEPSLQRFIKEFSGAEEFINGSKRWCLWFDGASPSELHGMPKEVLDRIEAVRIFREGSKATSTRRFATMPYLFRDRNLPEKYLLFPSVSSERRRFVPIGFMTSDVVPSNLTLIVPGADIYHFGVLTSTMHNAWMRQVCGRLKSDYRYSKDIVYNNFPWPFEPSDKQRERIEKTAQGILDARAKFPDSTLADLYDPLTMPKELLDAHSANDEAVDAAYGKRRFKNELERLEYLFDLYRQYTEPLRVIEEKSSRKRKKK